MIHNILVVDDNQPFLNLISKIFEKYKDKYSVHTSINGANAIEMLKSNAYSIVITDLQMPTMDGYALLEKIRKQFPDIPAIVITAFDKPKTESVVKRTGAHAYFTKPLVMDQLVGTIDDLIKRETEGGRLNNASLEMFIQLIEMESKTCTIRVLDEKTKNRGVLFFKEGELYNARFGQTLGKNAAYKVFSWDKVTLSIENSCTIDKREIHDELQAILLDAMRLKDELGKSENEFSDEMESFENDGTTAAKTPEEEVKSKLEGVVNVEKDIKSLKVGDLWSGFTAQATALGFYFDAGLFKGAYFEKDNLENLFIIPMVDGKDIEIVIGSKCSPDKVIRTLTE